MSADVALSARILAASCSNSAPSADKLSRIAASTHLRIAQDARALRVSLALTFPGGFYTRANVRRWLGGVARLKRLKRDRVQRQMQIDAIEKRTR
jgi:hypothetical protein